MKNTLFNCLRQWSIILLLIFAFVLNSCKKEVLTPDNFAKNRFSKTRSVESISYKQFLSAIDLNKTGILKAVLLFAPNEKTTMSVDGGSPQFELDMVTVRKLVLEDVTSYVIGLKPATPHAIQFQNLTVEIRDGKTSAFITTYIPDKNWIKEWREGVHIDTVFRGETFTNRINITDIPKINTLNNTENSGAKTTASSANSKSSNTITINRNKLSLIIETCVEYNVYQVVSYPCAEGHMTRATCNYYTEHGTWNLVDGDYPPSEGLVFVGVSLDCSYADDGMPPPGGGGSGGTTTPNPPSGYDPCDCDVPPPTAVDSKQVNSSVRLEGVPRNCCDETPPPLPPVVPEDPPSDYELDQEINIHEIGTDGPTPDMGYKLYYDPIDQEFKYVHINDPAYSSLINAGTFDPPPYSGFCTTQALRNICIAKGWNVGRTTVEFNRMVGQAFQEATFKLYKSKVGPTAIGRINYQKGFFSPYKLSKRPSSTGVVVPDWTFTPVSLSAPFILPDHMFYDAKAVNGNLYLSSNNHQIGSFLDVLSRKRVAGTIPPMMVFVTTVNTRISPTILAAAMLRGIKVFQSFTLIIDDKLYLLQPIEITPDLDLNVTIPYLKPIAGPVELELPLLPNIGPDYNELQP